MYCFHPSLCVHAVLLIQKQATIVHNTGAWLVQVDLALGDLDLGGMALMITGCKQGGPRRPQVPRTVYCAVQCSAVCSALCTKALLLVLLPPPILPNLDEYLACMSWACWYRIDLTHDPSVPAKLPCWRLARCLPGWPQLVQD